MVFRSESDTTPPAPPGVQLIVDREAALLAPYAMPSIASQGRVHPEPSHPYRGPFQRDRDRILHSAAFRRLSGKMQVVSGELGDYHRTRLTHTHEVASIARTIGRALRLNEDLIEALALFHDIGHPPYGHAGESVLNELMSSCGGFSHNRFALTIAQELERSYGAFPGLNLSHEVLAGQQTRFDKDGAPRLLEVQVVDAADSITYNAHDTDDAVKLGLVEIDELAQTGLVKECLKRIRRKFTGLDDSLLRRALVHELIEQQVSNMLERTAAHLTTAEPSNWREASESNFRIGPTAEMVAQKSELEKFLFDRVYRHEDVVRVCAEAQDRLGEMYFEYVKRPELLPERYQERAKRITIERMAGEYLAGMTDRFCDDHYDEIVGRS